MQNQDYKQALMAASLAVTRKRGNYTGKAVEIDVNGQIVHQYDASTTTRTDHSDFMINGPLDDKAMQAVAAVQKATLTAEAAAQAMSNVAHAACATLSKALGRKLTEAEIKDVVTGLV